MTSSPVRIGFVGAGTMGQCAHLRHYATLEGACVTAIAEPRERTRLAVAKRYDIPAAYPTATEMLAHEKLDAIVAAQPFTRYGIVLEELCRSGLPIFIEKPLASSVQVAQWILERLTNSTSRVMVGYHKRSDLAALRAKEEVDRLATSGECGVLRYIRITMPPGDWVQGAFRDLIDAGDPMPDLPGDPPPADMDEPTYQAYIQFVNFYIHQVNLVRYLLSEDYHVTFADSSGVLLFGQGDRSGVPCTIEMAPYHTTQTWEEVAWACFERGYVKLELPAPLELTHAGKVTIFRDPGGKQPPSLERPVLPSIPAMRQQAVNFLAFARGERAAPCDAAEAVKDLQVARDYIFSWKKAR